PVTRRLMFSIDPLNGKPREWQIYEDQVAAEQPDRPVNYDSLTDDIPESSKTVSAFAGDVNGFAARVSLVGGTTGILSTCSIGGAVRCDPTDPNYTFTDVTPPQAPGPPSGATREVFLGRTSS